MCDKEKIKIGCEEHTIKEWLANHEDIGKAHDASDEVIAEYKLYIDLCAKRYLTSTAE